MYARNLFCAGMLLAGILGSINAFAAAAPERQANTEEETIDSILDKDEVLGGKFSTWVELASDYVFRGESETNDGKIPSLKGSITWTHGTGVYLGLYMANNLYPGGDSAHNNPNINAIYGPYVGYSRKDIAGTGLNYNGFFFQYLYPGSHDSDYLEMFNYVDKQFGPLNMKLEYSPTITDWFGVKGLQSHNLAVHPSVALPHGFTLSGSVGYQFFNNHGPNLDANGNGKEELNWVHWNIGISRKVFGYNLDLRYHDTNIREGHHDFYGFPSNHQIVDGRFVIGISKSF